MTRAPAAFAAAGVCSHGHHGGRLVHGNWADNQPVRAAAGRLLMELGTGAFSDVLPGVCHGNDAYRHALCLAHVYTAKYIMRLGPDPGNSEPNRQLKDKWALFCVGCALQGNNGCGGGEMDAAIQYVADSDLGGLMSEESYQYLGQNAFCG